MDRLDLGLQRRNSPLGFPCRQAFSSGFGSSRLPPSNIVFGMVVGGWPLQNWPPLP